MTVAEGSLWGIPHTRTLLRPSQAYARRPVVRIRAWLTSQVPNNIEVDKRLVAQRRRRLRMQITQHTHKASMFGLNSMASGPQPRGIPHRPCSHLVLHPAAGTKEAHNKELQPGRKQKTMSVHAWSRKGPRGTSKQQLSTPSQHNQPQASSLTPSNCTCKR